MPRRSAAEDPPRGDDCGYNLLDFISEAVDPTTGYAHIAYAGPRCRGGDSGRRRRVVLDLTEVEHIDSYGIFVIHGLRQRLGEPQQGLVLIVPRNGRIRRAIELVRIADVIPTKETLEDAISDFGQSVF